MLRKYLTAAFLGVKSARLRSFLTVLGIAMGIFLVITILAVGEGTQKDVVSRITDLGANIITVQSVNQDLSQAQSSSPVSLLNSLAVANLTLDDVASVQKQPHVTAVAPVKYNGGQLYYGDKMAEPNYILITTTDYLKVRKLEFSEGTFFNPNSDASQLPEVVIGKKVKQDLFGNDQAVGKTIRYGGDQKVVVSGVLKAGQDSGQVDRTMLASSSIVSDPAQANLYSQIFARVDNVEHVTPAIESIKTTIGQYREKSSFSVTSSQDLLDASKNVLNVLTALISVLAVISLTMSGVGIMNMMVVAVTDRTKEIGVRKTVGASATNIFWQFLFEAVLLTALGGVIGLCMSVVTVYGIRHFMPIKPLLGPELILMGIGLSVLVGIIFGVGPAMRAARKEPIEALQTDRS